MTHTHALAEAFADIVREVREASFTVGEIAQIAGVQERQVRNWSSGTHRPAGPGRDALLDLRYVAKLLRDVYRPEGAEIWLHSRNQGLGGERPMDLLREHRFVPVLQAIERLQSGAV